MGCKAQTAGGPCGPARICNAADRPSPCFCAHGQTVNRLWGCFAPQAEKSDRASSALRPANRARLRRTAPRLRRPSRLPLPRPEAGFACSPSRSRRAASRQHHVRQVSRANRMSPAAPAPPGAQKRQGVTRQNRRNAWNDPRQGNARILGNVRIHENMQTSQIHMQNRHAPAHMPPHPSRRTRRAARPLEPQRQALMRQQLQALANMPDLSKDVREIVEKILG